MTNVHNGIVWVVGHGCRRAKLSGNFCYKVARRDILPLKISRQTGRGEQIVVGEKLHVGNLLQFSHTVYFYTIAVVNVDVFPLRDGKELIGQKLHITNSLSQLQLALQLASTPIHQSDVALATTKKYIPARAVVLEAVRAQFVQCELESLLGRSGGDALLDFLLAHPVCSFQLSLWLQESGIVLEEDFGILGGNGSIFVLALETFQVAPQLLVLDTLDIDPAASAIVSASFLVPPYLVALVLGKKLCPGLLYGDGSIVVSLGERALRELEVVALHCVLLCCVLPFSQQCQTLTRIDGCDATMKFSGPVIELFSGVITENWVFDRDLKALTAAES